MEPSPAPSPGTNHGRVEYGAFATTHWSVVLSARDRAQSTSGFEALSRLCETYWFPLYAYVRRRGHDADSAADLTQAFFGELLA